MGKGTSYRYSVFQERNEGVALSKSDSYAITSNDILIDGYGHFKQTGSGKTFTLPVASTTLKGCSIYVTAIVYTTKVAVAAGFGGNTSFDTATLQIYQTAEFWCSGDDWFALSDAVSST